MGTHYYKKRVAKACTISTYAGGMGSFLAFSCPICNKILVFLFGATVLMVYLEPYRPIIGLVSNVVLAGALYWKIKS